MDSETPSKLRKGTKSCTECRRRKVRCTWDTSNSATCRRCLERGSKCIAQTSNQPVGVRKLSSRQRITQLENELSKLSKRVNGLEARQGLSHTELDGVDEYDEEDASSESSDESQVVIEDRPSHLSSLFQNEWISVATQDNVHAQHERTSQARRQLLDAARSALQSLIPVKEDVAIISNYVTRWTSLVNSLFPFTFAPKSQQEVLEVYDVMTRPDIDPMTLASWILTITISSQLAPQESFSPNTMIKSFQKRQTFARRVLNVLERSILSHDSLIGTLEGLEVAITFLRFQMTRGNFHKTWLSLRRVIAIAELIGLPRAHRTLASTHTMSEEENRSREAKIQLWDSICFIDRFAGVLNNLPSATQRYSLSTDEPLVMNGVVQVRPYLLRLSNIALKIHDFDDLSVSESSDVNLYAAVLRLDGDLRILASSIPSEWWVSLTENIGAHHLLQFFYFCISMRVHLPFTLRQDPREEYSYSRSAGINACKALAKRWLDLRSKLPTGFFTCRILDVQAFTAVVVLLLVSHRSRFHHTNDSSYDVANDDLIDQVMTLMEEKSKEPINADYAQQTVETVNSLRALLQQNTSTDQDLKVTVPLLGKLHIRRKAIATQAMPFQSQSSMDTAQFSIPTNTPSTNLMTNGALSYSSWSDNPFSWSVEDDYEAMFQTHIMAEDLEAFGGWDNFTGQG